MNREKDTWSYVNLWYLIIPLAFIVLFFVAPLVKMFYLSLFEFQGVNKALGAFTWSNYTKFIMNKYYWIVLLKTVALSFLSAVICVIMGYPIAYHLCRMQGKAKSIVTAMVMLPLWVSITVRMFGLMTIIECGTYLAVEIGLVYCGLPYMIMILTGPIGNINQSVEEASYVCGAGFWTTFFRITLPLTIKGVISGFMLVFALNTAAFVVPVMLGSGKLVTMTTLIYQQATYIYDWGFAAAISVIFLIVSMTLTNSGKAYEYISAKKAARSAKLLRESLRAGGDEV
ncbi:MAG TPA: ABC transporter permease [Clostridia bacterium]|nr:ABC transporter permease [Clostridia bacterium]